MRRLVVAVATVGLSLAALPAAAAVAATGSAEQQTARAGVLVLSDFPAGWKQSPRPRSSDAALDAAAAKVKACAPFVAFRTVNRKNPRAQSPNFDQQQAQVTNSVSVYPSVARATAAMRTFDDARVPDCLERLFTSQFRKELAARKDVARRIASVRTSIELVPGVSIGDEAVAYQGTTDVALKDGTKQSIGLGIVSARAGDAITGYSWSADTDISAALQPAIVSSVGRLQAAQAAR